MLTLICRKIKIRGVGVKVGGGVDSFLTSDFHHQSIKNRVETTALLLLSAGFHLGRIHNVNSKIKFHLKDDHMIRSRVRLRFRVRVRVRVGPGGPGLHLQAPPSGRE